MCLLPNQHHPQPTNHHPEPTRHSPKPSRHPAQPTQYPPQPFDILPNQPYIHQPTGHSAFALYNCDLVMLSEVLLQLDYLLSKQRVTVASRQDREITEMKFCEKVVA